MYTLYGDGIHDDTLAIQELIDTTPVEVTLPVPKAHYLISKPLELPSCFRLCLPRYAEIKLADQSNCVMLKNKTVRDRQQRVEKKIWDYVNEYAPDAPCHDIEVVGGIWNCNNHGQNPNPIYTRIFEPAGYSGFGMLFYNVRNFRLSSLTIKDPVNFAVTLDTVSYFTVDNIVFDYNLGNPLPLNMDGIHLCGNCRFGRITNLQGTCYDDLVALNADEGSDGPITDIDIHGIYAENCHSAARLLTVKNELKNIHISDVHGTYYQYCIGITKYYNGKASGHYDGINLDHIYASKAKRPPLEIYQNGPGSYVYAPLYIEGGQQINSLKIADVYRKEYEIPVATIYVGKETQIDHLILDNIVTENHTDADAMPLLVNDGTIAHFHTANLYEDGIPVQF